MEYQGMQPNQQAMIMSAFQNETFIQNRLDIQDTPLYDTVVLAAAAAVTDTTSSLFTDVGPASGKTKALTNMTQSGILPSPQAFSIFGFRFRWREDILRADLDSILNGFALAFTLGQKEYNLGPLWYYATGGGIAGETNVSAAQFLTNGTPMRESRHQLSLPIVIESRIDFEAHLIGTAFTLAAGGAGGTGFTFQLLLDGLYARGVQ